MPNTLLIWAGLVQALHIEGDQFPLNFQIAIEHVIFIHVGGILR